MANRVDTDGIHLDHAIDAPVDVRFGGHRLWSCNPARDGRPAGHGRGVVVPWPGPIRDRLSGVAQVVVEPHLGGAALYDAETRFGDSTEPLEFVDELGNPLTFDKGGRFQRSFDRMDSESVDELTDASIRVLRDLVEHCGLDAYLCYGALLGAVRTGHMIGHDSDVDLAYLSKYTHPFDIIREARAAERKMKELGWQTVRMSAANFKVWVPLPSGKRAGVDVFGSFHIGDYFHLTGSLRGKLDRDQLLPFEPVTLEGVEFPAPRDLDGFLTYTYGPGWRVPDPAFHFEHPAENTQMMSQWWRGSRTRLWLWTAFYRDGQADRVPREHSGFAEWVASRLESGSRIYELGSGTARDAIWLAEQGYEVTASDYSGGAQKYGRARIKEAGVRVPYRSTNLENLHNLLLEGTRLAHADQPSHVYARMLVESMAGSGRDGLWRFCSLAGRRGGRTFLEFRTAKNKGGRFFFGNHVRTLPRVNVIKAEIEKYGGRILAEEVGRGLARLGEEDPVVCRLEVSWT